MNRRPANLTKQITYLLTEAGDLRNPARAATRRRAVACAATSLPRPWRALAPPPVVVLAAELGVVLGLDLRDGWLVGLLVDADGGQHAEVLRVHVRVREQARAGCATRSA